MIWQYIENGKTNEQVTQHQNKFITVYSNKKETEWVYFLDDNSDDLCGPFKDKEHAIQEALNEVDFDLKYGGGHHA